MPLNPLLSDPIATQQLPLEFNDLRGKRFLVTGAAGFIGGAVLRRLVSYGLDVVGTVQHQSEADELEKIGYRSAKLDLSELPLPVDILQGIDIVFHIAAMFQETEGSTTMYELVNHKAVIELAVGAHTAGVQTFVHCSTVGVHGDVVEIPATESSPYNPMDVYHRTKLAGELSLRKLSNGISADDMTIVINRPAMVYGPGDTRMMKLFSAIQSGRFLMIGNGKTLAHLGYVEEQVDSFLLCAVADKEIVHGESFNIASGTPINLNTLAGEIAQALGCRIPRWKVPLRPVWALGLACELLCAPLKMRPPISRRRVGFFSHNRAFDVAKAEKLLGFQTKLQLTEGIRETVAWYRKHGLLDAKLT